LRHRGHGVRPATPPRCVTAVDTCVEQYLLRRILLTSRGALTSGQVRSGQPVVTLQSGNRDHPPRDSNSRPLFVDRPTANDLFERSLALQRSSRSPRGLVAVSSCRERADSKRSTLRDDEMVGTVAVAVQRCETSHRLQPYNRVCRVRTLGADTSCPPAESKCQVN
jgi:hypothetical protein